MLGAIGQQLPFWDHDVDLLVVPQANASQLNGLLAVLDRYDVHQVLAVEVPTSNRAGREWQTALSDRGLTPLLWVDQQLIDIEPDVTLLFDGSSVLIRSDGSAIGIGRSDVAQIDFIAEAADRLPPQAQIVFAWGRPLDAPDPRWIDLTGLGTIDLRLDGGGLSINAWR